MDKITITEEREVEVIVCGECGMKYRIEAVAEKEDRNVLWPLEKVYYCPFCGERWQPCGHPKSAVRGNVTKYCSMCEGEARKER